MSSGRVPYLSHSISLVQYPQDKCRLQNFTHKFYGTNNSLVKAVQKALIGKISKGN